MKAATTITLVDFVRGINAYTNDECEVVATVAYLVNSGRVRLGGTFASVKIVLPPTDAPKSSFPLNIVRSIVTPSG